MSLTIVCPHCNGSGKEPSDPGTNCFTCKGAGSCAPADLYQELVLRMEALGEGFNEIKAEQESQRVDLTAALTRIWNKLNV